MKRSNTTTKRLFSNAGISSGMSVIELGCGPGEVTELLFELVGPDGKILAVDHSEELLSTARDRLEGVDNVRFTYADLNAGPPSYLSEVDQGSYDAVVGRRVLMYLRSPEQVIAQLVPWLRQDGIVVFEEADSTICPGRTVAMPAHDRAVAWLNGMLEAEGANTSMGFQLPSTLVAAGLKFDRMWVEGVVEGQEDQYSLAELLQLLAPRLESTGVAVASDIETVVSQVGRERDPTSVFVSSMRFCASGRKP